MLIVDQKQVPIEDIVLKHVSAVISILDLMADIKIEQKFRNEHATPIEATYRFPTDSHSVIHSFQCKTKNKTLIAKIKEKEEARDIHDDEISKGNSSFLMESDEESSDCFKIILGNLEPSQEIEIVVGISMELEMINDVVQFKMPLTMAPRYGSKNKTATFHSNLENEENEENENNFYKMDLNIKVQMPYPISEISSPSKHPISTLFEKSRDAAKVRFSRPQYMDRDFCIHFQLEKLFGQRIWFGSNENENNNKNNKKIQKRNENNINEIATMMAFQPNMENVTLLTEILFVIDRSGSMKGQNIIDARESLEECIKILPSSSTFNIIGFGSSFVSLFKSPIILNSANKKKALDHTKKIEADLGGTELLSPLQYIYSLPPPESGRSRQIFLFSDGSVSNSQKCIELVGKNVSSTRVFTFGIGDHFSSSLIKGIAKAGNGISECVNSSSQRSNMKEVSIRQVKRSLEPCYNKLKLTFNSSDDSKIRTAPSELPPLFRGEPYLIYALIPFEILSSISEIHLIAEGPKSQVFEFKFKVLKKDIKQTPIIHRLAAKKLISELEEGNRKLKIGEEAAKKELITLGKLYSLATSQTSFIAIEEKKDKQVSDSMLPVSIPNMLPKTTYSPNPIATSFRGGTGKPKKRTQGGSVLKKNSKLKNKSKNTKNLKNLKNSKDLKQTNDFQPLKRKSNDNKIIEKKNKTSIISPWGIEIEQAPASIKKVDPYLNFTFKGPKNNQQGLNCWLNATLMLFLSLSPVQQVLIQKIQNEKNQIVSNQKDEKNQFILDVAEFYFSFQKQKEKKFHQDLEKSFNKIWIYFQNHNFKISENHSISAALQLLLSEFESELSIENIFARKIFKISTKDSILEKKVIHLSLIDLNSFKQSFFPIHVLKQRNINNNNNNTFIPKNYCVFENISEKIYHFLVSIKEEDGYWIFDDLLDLKGYQGGFVSKEANCYQINLQSFLDNVCCFSF